MSDEKAIQPDEADLPETADGSGLNLSIRGFAFALVVLNLLVIGLALTLPLGREDPTYYFREFRLVTWFSFFQLLACAFLSLAIFPTRPLHAEKPASHINPAFLWCVLALGFFFLAVDELVSIHLYLGRRIHELAGLQKSHGTKWIGDTIMISYALIAIGILILFRSEILRFKQAWWPFVIAFLFLGATIVFDSSFLWRFELLLPEFFSPVFGGAGRGVTEESFKLLSECFFVIAIYTALAAAHQSRPLKSAPETQ